MNGAIYGLQTLVLEKGLREKACLHFLFSWHSQKYCDEWDLQIIQWHEDKHTLYVVKSGLKGAWKKH